MESFGELASGTVLSHCKCILFHRIWELLLDDEFMEAYEHGILIECRDGIRWWIFPHIFTYSVDYNEK